MPQQLRSDRQTDAQIILGIARGGLNQFAHGAAPRVLFRLHLLKRANHWNTRQYRSTTWTSSARIAGLPRLPAGGNARVRIGHARYCGTLRSRDVPVVSASASCLVGRDDLGLSGCRDLRAIDRAIEIPPSAPHSHVRLIDVPLRPTLPDDCGALD